MRLHYLAAISLFGRCVVFLTPTKAHSEPPIVAEVRVEGNQRIDEDAVLFHITQEPDQLLDEDALKSDIRSIYEMGFFSSVSANIKYIEGQPVLIYTVRERPQVIRMRIEGMNALSPTDPASGPSDQDPQRIYSRPYRRPRNN